MTELWLWASALAMAVLVVCAVHMLSPAITSLAVSVDLIPPIPFIEKHLGVAEMDDILDALRIVESGSPSSTWKYPFLSG